MGKFSRANKVKYVYSSGYTTTLASARKNNLHAPNGLLIHVPRDWAETKLKWWDGQPFVMSSNRVYLCWLGEPIEIVRDALAWVQSITHDKEFYIINCTKQEKST